MKMTYSDISISLKTQKFLKEFFKSENYYVLKLSDLLEKYSHEDSFTIIHELTTSGLFSHIEGQYISAVYLLTKHGIFIKNHVKFDEEVLKENNFQREPKNADYTGDSQKEHTRITYDKIISEKVFLDYLEKIFNSLNSQL